MEKQVLWAVAGCVLALGLSACAPESQAETAKNSEHADHGMTADTAPASADAASGLVQTPSAPGAKVYFISPADGAEVTGPLTIRFGLSGMGVAPAGVDRPLTGHHHLFINADITPEIVEGPIPSDAQHVHFGGGQTETTITLPAGTHTLMLVLGDQNHYLHSPPVYSEKITVTIR